MFSKSLEGASTWNDLHKIGGMAALAIIVLIPIQMFVFFIWMPPTTVIGWFSFFQQEPLIGLIGMNLLLIVDYVLLLVVFLSL